MTACLDCLACLDLGITLGLGTIYLSISACCVACLDCLDLPRIYHARAPARAYAREVIRFPKPETGLGSLGSLGIEVFSVAYLVSRSRHWV